MPIQEDLTGRQFGRWTVLRRSDRRTKDGARQPYWWCQCSCEAQTVREVFVGDLRRGHKNEKSGSLSCGCLMRELRSLRKKHGMCDHPAYESWKMAKSRCNNPNDNMYHLYGGRGITMCERWSNDFRAFWEDMGATWRKGLSIDRINFNGNYEPGNCRWATPKEQGNNRRTNNIINTEWGKKTVTEASELSGINRMSIFARMRYGWPEEDLLLPVRPCHKKRAST